jgi:hypothetical protein
MIDIIHGIWNNKLKIVGGYASLWVLAPRAAELITRLAYGFASEQVRTSAQALRDIVSVATRPKGAPRPPIIPARDIAAVRGVGSAAIQLTRQQASRLALRAIPVLASPATVTVGAGLTAGFLISHGIGQLPDVKKTAHLGQQYVMGSPI